MTLGKSTALLFCLFQIFSVQVWFMQIIFTMLVRYLSIFHGATLLTINETSAIMTSRIICTGWAFFSTFYESQKNDLTQNSIVRVLMGLEEKEKKSNSITIQGTVLPLIIPAGIIGGIKNLFLALVNFNYRITSNNSCGNY